jgi:SPP1 gp7 family putative phage head morphogenesis protein
MDDEERFERNRHDLLKAEALFLIALLAAMRRIVARGRARRLSDAAIAVEMRRELLKALVQFRRASRQLGLLRLIAEAKELGLTVVARELNGVETDFRRSALVAKSLSDQWAKTAVRFPQRPSVADYEEEPTEETPVKKQSRDEMILAALLYAIKRIAVTESAQAFNAERGAAAKEAEDLAQLRKRWDARLDSKVCPVCADADGTIVPINEQFPLGEPGGVHPRCRCSWSIVT